MRRPCERCGVAYAKTTGRWCAVCYDTGEAARVDAHAVAEHIRTLRSRGLSMAGIAETAGCSWRALSDIARGKTTTTRREIADAVLAIQARPSHCATCEDVDTALFAASDPEAIARRLGTTTTALARHMYRCGRPDLERLFAKPDSKRRYERTRA